MNEKLVRARAVPLPVPELLIFLSNFQVASGSWRGEDPHLIPNNSLQNYSFRDISEYHIETQNLRAKSVPSRLRVKIY